MNSKLYKKVIATILCMVMVLSAFPAVYADSIPEKYVPYVEDGRVDYEELHVRYFQVYYRPLTSPTSSFTVSVNGEVKGYSDSGNTLEVSIGDTLTIQNTSTKGSGTALSKCDFQITRPDGTYSLINNQSFVGEYTMSKVII